MYLNEVMQKTGLTRKALEYYQLKGFIQPEIMDNGYRRYSTDDLDKLKKIAFLRGLDLKLSEIERILEGDLAVSDLLRWRQLQSKRNSRKQKLLLEFEREGYSAGLREKLESILREESVEQRLSRLFPDYFAQIMTMNFQQFLQDPIDSAEREENFRQLVDFLDQLPPFDVDPEWLSAMTEASEKISYGMMQQVQEEKLAAIENPEEWIEKHRGELEAYHAFTQSQSYRENPLFEFQQALRQYMQENRFHDVVTPLMRKINPSYDEYYEQMIKANEKLLQRMPEFSQRQ